MELGKARETVAKLAEVSKLYPPMDVFENVNRGLKNIFNDMVRMSKALEKKKEEFVEWLNTLLPEIGKRLAIVFYGRGVYGFGHQTPLSDIDALVLISDKSVDSEERIRSALRFPYKPSFVHVNLVYNISSEENVKELVQSWRKFCFANSLVISSISPNPYLLSFIEQSRKSLSESPFFEGGLGELLTYAAYKVVHSKEKEFFRKGFDPSGIFSKGLITSFIDIDFSHSLTYSNECVRKELAKRFEEEELKEITSAAIRRIRVKKEKREELKEMFLKEIMRLRN